MTAFSSRPVNRSAILSDSVLEQLVFGGRSVGLGLADRSNGRSVICRRWRQEFDSTLRVANVVLPMGIGHAPEMIS